MKKKHTFNECYKILLLSPNCDWNTLRKSYKLQIKKWHPDKYPENSPEKKTANEKIKNINTAYNQLLRYYRQHNKLPLPESAPKITPKTHASENSQQNNSQQQAIKKTQKKQPGYEPHSRSNFKKPAIIILTTFIITILVVMDIFTADEIITNEKNKFNNPTNNTKKTNIRPLSNSNELKTRSLHQNNQRGIEKKHSLNEAHIKRISYGSTIGEIIEIQGTPDKIIENIWYYGESEIYIENGKVTGWKRSNNSPINTSINFGR